MLALAPTQTKRAPILGKQFRLVFHALDGLREGDPVTVGGVDAGRVVNIDFAPEEDWKSLNPPGEERPAVLVTVALRSGFDLAPGTAYRIISTLRGRHFINIIPPPPGARLAENSILNQELEILSDNQLQATIRNFQMLNQRTEDLRKDFANPEFRRELKDLASNLRFYSAEFLRISQSSNQQVVNMTRTLDAQEQALLRQAELMTQQTVRVRSYVKAMVPTMQAQLQNYRAQLDKGQAQIDNLVKAGKRGNQMMREYGLLIEYSPLGKIDGDELSQRLRTLSTQLEDYANLAGDMHRLSSDPQVQQDIRQPLKKAKERSQKLKEQLKGYEQQLDSFQWLMPEERSEQVP